jgi:hypothetical protein
VHRGPFATVQHAELDSGGVDHAAHLAAQGVDLADNLPLGHAADGRIAAHLGHGVAVHREQHRLRAQPGRGECGFAPGMSGADDGDVVVVDHGGVSGEW